MKNEKGFSAAEGLLILVIVGLIGFVGWFVWQNRTSKSTSTTSTNSSTSESQNTTKPADSDSTTPQSFTNSILSAISTNNETKLGPLLSTEYAAARKTSLDTSPCKGVDAAQTALFCGSLLDKDIALELVKVTPVVTETTFKDGKTGKAVTYKLDITTGEKGTNYFTFKLIAKSKSWQLYDYGDLFVEQGSTASTQPVGLRKL